MNTGHKVRDRAGALAWRRAQAGKVVFTNGVFDLLHPGHLALLEAARSEGDALVVGLNSDASVRRLGKGAERPLVPEAARARLLAGFASVDCVTLFDEDTPLALIELLAPDVLAKGADYTRDRIVGADPASWSACVPRPDGRKNDELRPLVLERGANPYAEGSCLVRAGGTLVHCTASVEPGVPSWRRGTGQGWVTAEYAMLPRATSERTARERNGPGGRTQEIQRLVGRSLRAAMGTMAFGEYTIKIDCDVLQADGGTRTASITGACVALADATAWLSARTGVPDPFGCLVAAVSVGIIEGEPRLDLAYLEDRDAGVDANFVMLEPDRFVEVQGTGEHGTFSRGELDTLLEYGARGIAQLFAMQRKALGR